MNDRVKKLASSYLRKRAADEAEEPTKTVEDVSVGRIVDLAQMIVAFDAYLLLLEQKGERRSDLLNKGLLVVRRFADEVTAGIQKYLMVLSERPDAAPLRMEFRQAMRTGNATTVARNQAALFRVLFPWLRTRPGVFNDLFSGRVAKAARELAAAVEDAAPQTTLNKLASITPVSGLTAHRRWAEKAAAEVGAPITPVESVMADAMVAKAAGEQLTRVEAQIAAAKPGTPQEAELQAQKVALVDQIFDVALQSADPSAVMAATVAAKPTLQYATEIGKKLGHTPEQEDAMMSRSRVLIAAGAGSGKTRVSASKVAYHVNELGQDAASILATSFTTKAAAEFLRRVGEYGAVIEGQARDGFGTTHSIAGKILNKKATSFRRANYIGRNEGWKQNTVLRLAMEQVKMEVAGAPAPPFKPRGIWDNAFVADPAAGRALTPEEQAKDVYTAAVEDALGYFQWAARTWSNGAGDWASRQVPFLQDMRTMDPKRLTPKQRQWLNDLFAKVKNKGVPTIKFRVASEVPTDEDEKGTPKPKGKRTKLDDYVYYKAPAKQWFNLGRNLTRRTGDTEVPIPLGEFKNAISILKGQGLSPSEAWHGSGPFGPESDHAAVYAAYEWLKGGSGEPEFSSTGDMDDILIDTVTALVGSPTLRRQLQAQYKVLLIDEAQDLNAVQHLMFGLMAGYLDPKTKEPWPDKHMTADTFCLIGDDKQCVDIGTLIALPNGETKKAGECHTGDLILSYRNGAIVPQKVNHAVLSGWDWGYKVTTESGHTLTMSPNHKLWATEPQTEETQVAVYLMFREDMGFRVGITNKGKVGKEDDYLNSYGSRCFMEKAERLWILDICVDREEALLKEIRYSLQYGIPTAVFNGENRGLNQARIDALFQELGKNGRRLLEDRHLAFHLPHWMSQSYTKHDRNRHTVNLVAHSSSNTQVAMEWAGDKFDILLDGYGVKKAPGDRRRLRRWFQNYRDGLAFAELVSSRTGANLSHRLSTPEGMLRKTTASGLFEGMSIPVREGSSLALDPILSIEKVSGQFVDLDVGDASNFFGNDILTSNSIYEFRGADPDEFIDKSNMTEGGDDFQTKLLDTNFRSGQAIVDAANRLIARNKKQVPMVCKANVDRNGMGRIVARQVESTEDAAASVAEEIEGLLQTAQPGSSKFKDFGVAVRSNAEAYSYGLELLKKGIPFKSNAQFFNDTNTKALIGWLTIAEKGLDGPPDLMEDAIKSAVKVPYSRLGQAFFTALEERAGNLTWTRWLVDGGWQGIYTRGDMRLGVEHFVNNVLAVSKMGGSPSDILNQLMTLNGIDGESVQNSLVNSVVENDEVMAELAAEAENGVVTREQIEDMAIAPIQPLLSLLRGKDELGSAMTFVRKLQAVNAKVASKDTEDEIDRDAVTIGTMHSWKGLEVPNMYVPMVGSKFPRAGREGVAEDGPALASERRLAYVAITRAEQRCVILDIPHPTLGTRSQFVGEACIPVEGSDASRGAIPKLASDRDWTDSEIEQLRIGDPDEDEALMEQWSTL